MRFRDCSSDVCSSYLVRVQGLDEREHQLKVGADAVENQQGRQMRLAGTYLGAQGLSIQIDGTEDVRLRHASSPVGWVAVFHFSPDPCGSEPARDEAVAFNITVA